ncbi:MAG TPA: pyridoxal-dependent decarboxylase [Gemmatimonadales bacterium]|nr:pyridoxal-dependent decarboxylase [Gemmatimonadales bacterium]
MDHSADEALRAWFLGPRAENADLLERLMVEALRDHVFWRRNHHPEDGLRIREADRRREGYEASVATLTQELLGLLADLKQDVPFFSGRYQAHMVGEQTIAAQVAYIATMLYNPNNVAGEAAPVTTRLELEVAAQLAAMMGYDPKAAWGHLSSGGTVANFEALWIARSLHYLPVALAGAAADLGLSLEVTLPDGRRAALADLPLWSLLNIDGGAALDLWDALRAQVPAEAARTAVDAYSLASIGYQDYSLRLARHYGDQLPAAVVLVAATAHYSWEKIARALGIGAHQLRLVPVDRTFRMDPDALWKRVRRCADSRTAILACVSVCGTTEEGAVDRLDQVLEVRERARRELGLAFHVHADACFGGYASAITWGADGRRRSAEEIRTSTGIDWPSEEWVRSITALGRADSISVDPHKLGFVPYPAGAFLLKDRRARELVAVDPPYLTATGRDPDELFLGRCILEGSKPGAAAAAVWLSHRVLPLDERGYGHLISRTVVGAHRLHSALTAPAAAAPFRVVTLPRPDLSIVCFALTHPDIGSLVELNALNEGIYERLSIQPGRPAPDYMLTRTRLQAPMYEGAVDAVLGELGVCTVDDWRAAGAEGLVVLRTTVMDPFLAEAGGVDHVAGLIAAVRRAAAEAVREIRR